MITQEDIARELGLSNMTVYRCLNNKGSVSPKTRRRIEEFIREKNYRPNQTARNLKLKKNNVIGVLLPSFTYSYYPQIIECIRQNLKSQYNLLLCLSNEDPVMEREQLEVLLSIPVAGIFLCPVNQTESVDNCRFLQEQNVPFTLFDRYFSKDELQCSFVATEARSSSAELVNYLYSLGHRRIAHIGGKNNDSFSQQMFEGYLDALAANNLPYDEKLVYPGTPDYESGWEGMKELVARGVELTAVHCVNDPAAMGAMEFCRRNGIRVPEEISVTGFSDIGSAQNAYAPLTTCREPTEEIGKIATELLLEQIESGSCIPARHYLLKGTFIPRQSCVKLKI